VHSIKEILSSVAAEAERIVSFPGGNTRCVVVPVTFSNAAVLFPNAGEATSFPSLVYGLSDPVDSRVSTDRFVAGVDEYNFIILVHTVLIDPVRVQYTQVTTTTANAFFRNTP